MSIIWSIVVWHGGIGIFFRTKLTIRTEEFEGGTRFMSSIEKSFNIEEAENHVRQHSTKDKSIRMYDQYLKFKKKTLMATNKI